MRNVKNSRPVPNATLRMRNYEFALRNSTNVFNAAVAAAPLVTHGKFAAWLGHRLGTGTYGTAFRTTYGRELYSVLAALKHTVTCKRGMPRFGSNVVVKLSMYDIKTPYEQWLHGCIREAAVHKLASELPPVKLRGIATVDAARHVPALFVGGLFEDPRTGAAIFVTVMAQAPGVPLKKWMAEHALDLPMFLKIERAVTSLWLSGIVHADLHPDNVMTDGRVVNIIDFGFAVVLSEAQTARLQTLVVKALQRRLAPTLNSNTLGYVDSVQAGRGAPFYHDDVALLSNLQKKLGANSHTVDVERLRSWGIANAPKAMRMFKSGLSKTRARATSLFRPKKRSRTSLT